MSGAGGNSRETVHEGGSRQNRPELPELLAGRYRILECIGEGGMGIVCRGFDLDLEEIVAVKLLRVDFADDDGRRARFRREVKLARRVTHANVARVFEFGHDGALCFLTMEFIPGDSLRTLLDAAAPLPPEQVRTLALRLCEGLAAAHDAGVVHGDIKPGNILMAPARGAVLTDFGIARALTDDDRPDDGMAGTPLYMAPEQARGEAITPRTDVYAVGVLLFEALTGTHPFGLADPGSLLALKRRGDAPELARVASDMPDEWKRLIAACLCGAPEDRPGDARALLERLAPGFSFPALYEQPAPLAVGDGPRWIEARRLDGDAAYAWVTGDLVDALARIRGLRVVAAAPGQSHLRFDACIEGDVCPASDGLAVTLRVRRSQDGSLTVFTVLQPRTELHQLGADLAARVAAVLGRQPAASRRDVLDAEVSELYVQARHAYLTAHLDRSLALFEAALARSPGHPLLQLGHTLARVQAAFMFRTEAADEIAELRAAVDELVVQYDELGEPHLARARIQLAFGDVAGSARSLCVAIARSPSLVEAYVLLADTLIDIGRLPDAARRLDIALALDSSSIFAWTCRARLYAYQDRWAELYEIINDTFAVLRFRSVLLPRLMLWHPDRTAFEALDRVLAGNDDNLPAPMLDAARALVAFALQRDDGRSTLDHMRKFVAVSTNMRRNAFVTQLMCELACVAGELDEARAHLEAADGYTLTDWQWIEHCPVLRPLRSDPSFAAVRARVRMRADAVAEAIWG